MAEDGHDGKRGDVEVLGKAFVLLTVLNVVVFTLWQFPGARSVLAAQFVTSGDALAKGAVWTLLTAAFSHEAFGHLAINMVLLYIFGRELEVIYGRGNLVLLYLIGAGGAFLTHIGLSVAFGDPATTLLGASGAVMAIAVTTVLLDPQRQLDFGLFTVPLWLLVAAFVLLDLSGVMQATQGVRSGVAHGAHLGGAVAGAVFKLLDLRLFSPHNQKAAALGPALVARLRRRLGYVAADLPEDTSVVEIDVALLNSHDELVPLSSHDELVPLGEQVDAILGKISREGLESLTVEERELLDQASQAFRRRTP